MKTLGSVVFEALLYCFEMLLDLYNKVLWRTRDAGSRQELDLCGSGGGSDGGSSCAALRRFRSCTLFHNKTSAANEDFLYSTTLTPTFFFLFFWHGSSSPVPLPALTCP